MNLEDIVPRNIYIPEVIFGVNSNKSDYCRLLLYTVGEYRNLWTLDNVRSPHYENFIKEYYASPSPMKYFSRGEVPPGPLKSMVTAFPNTPFRPSIENIENDKDLEKYVDEYFWIHFIDPIRKLNFNLIDQRVNYTICNLGVDKGLVISDAVVGFKYSGRDYGDIFDLPRELCLVRVSGKEYEYALRDSKLIRDFLGKIKGYEGIKTKHLVPGKWYRRKGLIKFNGQEYNSKENLINKVVCYLGEWRFANGKHMSSPYRPGDKYTTKPVFLTISNVKEKSDGELTLGENTEICSFNLDTILCEIPGLPNLSFSDIQELKTRFEYSMWSHKFWNTPGIVERFALMSGEDKFKLSNKSFERHTVGFHHLSGNIIPKEVFINTPDLENIQDLIIGKKLNKDYYNIFWSKGKYLLPVTLKNSDISKPLEIIPPTSKDNIGKLYGTEWLEDLFFKSIKDKIDEDTYTKLLFKIGKTSMLGVKYYVRGRDYVFKGVIDFILSPNVSLATNSNNNCCGSFKSWPICSTIS